MYISNISTFMRTCEDKDGQLITEDFNKRLNKIILLEIDPIMDEVSQANRLKFYKKWFLKTVTTTSILLIETPIKDMR